MGTNVNVDFAIFRETGVSNKRREKNEKNKSLVIVYVFVYVFSSRRGAVVKGVEHISTNL